MSSYYDAYYRKAMEVRRLIAGDFAAVFGSGVHALLTPTTPTPAFAIGEVSDPYAMYLSDIFTVTANLAGVPAMSVPVGFVDGLPVGAQVIAPHFGESAMLGVAYAIERALGVGGRMTERDDSAPEGAPTYELVVGLEVHVQLKTRTKIFCPCPTDFGAPPNANTCPVCLALPGALPVLNGHAVQLAVRAALALECTVHRTLGLRAQELLLPGPPEGLPDLAVRPADRHRGPAGHRRR